MATANVQGLNCPNCGGPLNLRSFGRALSVVCPQCLSVLDAHDPNLQILQKSQIRERVPPLIPLGTRGTLAGVPYEAIGFQVRTVVEEGEAFSWHEYLLFNPYRGFRYLTQYNGHWNDVKTVQALPETKGPRAVRFRGETFISYSTSQAQTTYVLGEFPWQVRVGEEVAVRDFVSVPRVLSSEQTPEETVWSLGEYMTGAQVWEAFKLPGQPPPAYGVFENQPSPYDAGAGMWGMAFRLLAALAVVTVLTYGFSSGGQVFEDHYTWTANPIVSRPFEVTGHTTNLSVRTTASDWLYVRYGLVDQATGHAIEFSRQAGNRDAPDKAVVPSVPAGKYYLRIEPESQQPAHPVNLTVTVVRGDPSLLFPVIASLLLFIPPMVKTWRRSGFERERWRGAS